MPKSPGKKRQPRGAAAGSPGPSPAAIPARVAASSFASGDHIVHRTFGAGEVVAIDGVKLEIAFKTAGTRVIRQDFVNRRPA